MFAALDQTARNVHRFAAVVYALKKLVTYMEVLKSDGLNSLKVHSNGVKVSKEVSKNLDNSTIDVQETERYNPQTLGDEYSVHLHFAETNYDISAEIISVLKTVYMENYLRKMRGEDA